MTAQSSGSATAQIEDHMRGQVTYVYRFFNADDDLLYVGIAKNLKARFRQHSKDKAWWCEVERSASEECVTLAIALAKESTAILRESPKYNLAIPTLPRHDLLQARAEIDPLLAIPIMERLRVAENDGMRLGMAMSDLAILRGRYERLEGEAAFEREAAFTARAHVSKLTRGLRDTSKALDEAAIAGRQMEADLSSEKSARVAAEARVQMLEAELRSVAAPAPRRPGLAGLFGRTQVTT